MTSQNVLTGRTRSVVSETVLSGPPGSCVVVYCELDLSNCTLASQSVLSGPPGLPVFLLLIRRKHIWQVDRKA